MRGLKRDAERRRKSFHWWRRKHMAFPVHPLVFERKVKVFIRWICSPVCLCASPHQDYLESIHQLYEDWLIKRTSSPLPAPVLVSDQSHLGMSLLFVLHTLHDSGNHTLMVPSCDHSCFHFKGGNMVHASTHMQTHYRCFRLCKIAGYWGLYCKASSTYPEYLCIWHHNSRSLAMRAHKGGYQLYKSGFPNVSRERSDHDHTNTEQTKALIWRCKI